MRVRAVRRQRHELERRSRDGRGIIARIFVFMWIPHQIRCGIHMIMLRAAMRQGRGRAAAPGRGAAGTTETERARGVRGAGAKAVSA